MNKKELIPLEKNVKTLAEKIDTININSLDTLEQAVMILSQMNKYADSVKEKKELLTKPLNEALKNARGMFKSIETTYESAIELLRGKMSVYQSEQVKLRRDAEQRIAHRVATGSIKLENGIAKIEKLDTVEKEIATDQGLVQFREVKKFEVIDMKKLPLQYHLPNDKAIQEEMKKGNELLGVKYYIEQVPVNYR